MPKAAEPQLEGGKIHVGHERRGRDLLLLLGLGRLLISSWCWSLSLIILLNEYLHALLFGNVQFLLI